jgi:polar amino acid transport system substrate-binding protein
MKALILGIVISLQLNISTATAEELKFSMLEGSESQNISMCVVREAYNNIGISTKFIKFPTFRSLVMSNDGEFDGESSRVETITKKYKNLIIIPIPTIYMEGMAFTKTVKGFTPSGFKSLSKYNVVINLGAQFAVEGTEGFPMLQAVSNYTSVFKMLDLGRADFAVAPHSNGVGLIRELGLWHLKPLQPPLLKIPMYHFLHKKNEHLVTSIQGALKKMEASGRIEEIYNSYLASLINKEITPNFKNMDGPSVPCPQ